MWKKGLSMTYPYPLSIPTAPKFLDIPRPTSFLELKKFWSHLKKEWVQNVGLNKIIIHRNLMITLLIYKGGLKVSDLATIKSSNSQFAISILPFPPYSGVDSSRI